MTSDLARQVSTTAKALRAATLPDRDRDLARFTALALDDMHRALVAPDTGPACVDQLDLDDVLEPSTAHHQPHRTADLEELR